MTHHTPLSTAAERQAHFSVLAAIAKADNHLDDAEVDLFEELMKLHGVTGAEADDCRWLLAEPPPIRESAGGLRSSDARFTLYLDACFMVRADEVLTEEEAKTLEDLVDVLELSEDQVDALEDLAGLVGAAEVDSGSGADDEDLSPEQALDAVEAAGIPLSAVGHRVPVGAR